MDTSEFRDTVGTLLARAGSQRQPHRLHRTARCGADGWPVYDVTDALPGL